LAEVAYAWEDDLIGLAESVGVTDEGVSAADGVEAVLDGSEIAGAVV
jgi:hypothetical protein